MAIPYYLSCTQVNFFLVAASVFITHSALATSCRVKQSEYAYRDDTFTRTESANCMKYPQTAETGTIAYTHCAGQQLKLSDSDRGSNTQYTATCYYVWSTGSDGQLLFIFPTRVSMTTITLHYYSDSVRGLPRLRFYAVPDDFDVWDAVTAGNPYAGIASVPPGGEPAGRRSVSTNTSFNTMKVLMYKYSSNFPFAVNEVEFFRCNTLSTTAPGTTNDSTTSTVKGVTPESTKPRREITNRITGSESADNISTGIRTYGELDPNNTAIGTQNKAMNVAPVVTILIGVGVAIPLVLLVIVVVVLLYLRKSSQPKSKPDYNDSYSTLRRGDNQQLQPHPQQPPLDTDLYDQIQLSPSTGQSEMVSTTEIENINIPSSQQPRVSPNTDTDQGNKISGEDNVSTSEQPTYVAVKIKQKKSKHLKGKNFPKTASSLEKNKEEIMLHSAIKVKKRETTPTSVDTTESLEALYSIVQKKPKADRDKEEKIPPPPPYSVEELYTAVNKNAKGSAMEVEDGAPQIPPHTIEDLYAAVMKKPKGDPEESGTDGAPPIPPYTVDDC